MSDLSRPLHIAALCGSLRGARSTTRRALDVVADEILATGATIDLVDLAALPLPFREAPAWEVHAGTVELRDRVARADALLLGTPEYHNSFSGALKNALDLLGADQLRGKLFGLLGVGGGAYGALNALGHLRYVVRGVGGWSLPAQVSVASSGQAFADGRPLDRELDQRLRAFGKELVRFARLHALEPSLEAGLIRVIDRAPE
ncbi:MAG: NAD(P)H-dependent oxidoreductase [Gemmatimonadetes bacterium]|nr:NAD(P)H-dependent oxidoreductase [Gemmatimonadota bacterium]